MDEIQSNNDKHSIIHKMNTESNKRIRHNNYFIILLAVISFFLFLKMCKVTLDNKDQREPNRYIYDSH
jgi:hypothetical protein